MEYWSRDVICGQVAVSIVTTWGAIWWKLQPGRRFKCTWEGEAEAENGEDNLDVIIRVKARKNKILMVKRTKTIKIPESEAKEWTWGSFPWRLSNGFTSGVQGTAVWKVDDKVRVVCGEFEESYRNLKKLPRWLSGEESPCQFRRHRRCGFNPWVRKILWGRKWQPTPVFLPGESMDRQAWWATVHGVTKRWTWLSAHTKGTSRLILRKTV